MKKVFKCSGITKSTVLTLEIESLITIATCVIILFAYACKGEKQQFIGNYYISRMGSLDIVNSDLKDKIEFSIYKDGTGYSYIKMPSCRFYIQKNEGAFTWEMHDGHFLVEWKNGEKTPLVLMKNEKTGRYILFAAVCDENRRPVMQIIGVKMTQKGLDQELNETKNYFIK